MHYNYSIFADCGAPSLYNKLSRVNEKKGVMGATFAERKFDDYSYTDRPEYHKYREDYIKFLQENKDKLTTYSNLDVINNPSLTWQNQKILESNGLHPIPVFHLGCNEKWLHKYVDNYDYIAIGGLIPNPTSVLIPWLDKTFRNCLLDEKGFPRVKVHGFACTSMPLMIKFPWYSVDSATSRKLAMYGWIVLPEYGSGDLKTVRISSRDIPLKNRWTPGYLKEFEKQANAMGTTLEELSTNGILRVIWNYTMYRTAVAKQLPKWPWNYYTQEPMPYADKQLIVYLAGVFSKVEETTFWEAISKNKEMDLAKGRLQSFFYRGSLEHIISLKHGS